MTALAPRGDLVSDLLDLVGHALRAKLAAELGRGRLARQSLADLSGLLAAVTPRVQTLAARSEDDEALSLCDLIAERWPADTLPDPDALVDAALAGWQDDGPGGDAA